MSNARHSTDDTLGNLAVKGQGRPKHLTTQLVELVNQPAYLLFRVGCEWFKYEFEQNETLFQLTAAQYDYHEQFQFKHATAKTFLESILLVHFDEVGQRRRTELARKQAQVPISQKQWLFDASAVLVRELQDYKHWTDEKRAESAKIFWKLYAYLEQLMVYSGYLRHVTTHYENDAILFEVQLLAEGPYEFTMTPSGLCKMYDLAQALYYSKTVYIYDQEPHYVTAVVNNLRSIIEQRFCYLDLSPAASIASLLRADEDHLTFKTYDLSNNEHLPNNFYRLIQDVKNCPLVTSVKNPGKIYAMLCYANRANAELLLDQFPARLTLTTKA